MVQCGVIKWTFLYSMIFKQPMDRNVSDAAASKNPIVLMPRKYDFLVIPKYTKDHMQEVEDIHGMHMHNDTNIYELKRALDEVKKKRIKAFPEIKLKPWQHELDLSFNTKEKVSFDRKIIDFDESFN